MALGDMNSVTKTIGDRRFDFGMMSATKAVRVQVALAKVIGQPIIRAFARLAGTDAKTSATGLGDIAKQILAAPEAAEAIGMLTSRVDPDELLVMMAHVFSAASCEGQPIKDIDSTFAGRNKDLWLAFVEGLKVNFKDFIPAGRSPSAAGETPS